MRIVLDTTVLIDVLRGSSEALDYVDRLDAAPACSEISRVEVLRGVRSPERAPAEELMGTVSWVPLDEAVARRAGELGRRWRSSHPSPSVADLVIAATAEALGAALATANVRHFPMFPELRPPY